MDVYAAGPEPDAARIAAMVESARTRRPANSPIPTTIEELGGALPAPRQMPTGDPQNWTDATCQELAAAWQRRRRGYGDPQGSRAVEHRGYREWGRRLKARA